MTYWTFISVFIVVFVVFVAVCYVSSKYSYFHALGLKGPTPSIFKLGNMRDFIKLRNSKHLENETPLYHYSKTLYEWSLKYGKIYGYYEALSPVICIADADLVVEIFVQHSDSTSITRRSYSMPACPNQPDAHMFLNDGLRWKRVRRCIESVLNNKRTIDHSQNTFDLILTKEFPNGKPHLTTNSIKKLVSQAVFKTIFPLEVDCENELQMQTDEAFRTFETHSTVETIIWCMKSTCFHAKPIISMINRCAFGIKRPKTNPMNWFHTRFTSIADIYEGNQNQHGIFSSLKKFALKRSATENGSMHLTNNEVHSNTFLIYFGSYETTSTTIQFACLVLSQCSDIRLELLKEIKQYHEVVKTNSVQACDIKHLTYLDLFVEEVLRMFPVASSMVSRRCTQTDLYIGKNKTYFIPRNADIVVDILSLHYDGRLWGPLDPFEFHPERHLDARHRAAWLPFGNCLIVFTSWGEGKALFLVLNTVDDVYLCRKDVVNDTVLASIWPLAM
jgi:cytochrome P450